MWRHGLVAAGFSLLAAACGGGGDSGDTVGVQPVGEADSPSSGEPFVLDPPVAVPGTHRVKLTWHGPSTGQTVSVWLADDMQDFHAIATGVSASAAEVDLGASWKLDWPSAHLRLRACPGRAPCIDSNAQPLVEALVAAIAKLDPEPRDQSLPPGVFSSRVALSADGNTLAVADPLDFPSTWPQPSGKGSIQVFRRCGRGCWRREARLTNFDVATSFGDPMALSGDGRTLAVGAYDGDGPVGSENWTGGVYVFVRDEGASWRQQALLRPAQPLANELFGYRMAIDHGGSRLVVGGVLPRIHVFARDGTSIWRQQALIEEPPTGAYLIPGRALALSGNGRMIASSATIPSWLQYIPAVFVYAIDAGGLWTRRADLRGKPPMIGYSDSFGDALSFDHAGTTLAVGEPTDYGDASDTGNDPGNLRAPNAGAVYIFGAVGSTWQRRAFLKARNAAANDSFGADVALSGDGRVLLGKACGYSGNVAGVRRNHRAGTVIGQQGEGNTFGCYWGGSGYMWTQDEAGRWNHAASVIPVGTDLVSYGFFSIALSADGMTLALGTNAYYPERPQKSRVFVY